jgi:hypothetical protein
MNAPKPAGGRLSALQAVEAAAEGPAGDARCGDPQHDRSWRVVRVASLASLHYPVPISLMALGIGGRVIWSMLSG